MSSEHINIGISILSSMINNDLFELGVMLHLQNLKDALANRIIQSGQMCHYNGLGEGQKVEVGDENHESWYRKLLLLANGTDIADLLRENGIIAESEEVSFTNLTPQRTLPTYLQQKAAKDLAIVYDRDSQRVTRVGLNPEAASLEGIVVEELLPEEFMSEDGSVSLRDEDHESNVGRRTQAAVKSSRGFYDPEGKYHSIDAVIIKGTIYNPLGFGIVAHFHEQGLQTFHFRYAPDHQGQFIDKEQQIIGVLRTYELKDKHMEKVSEKPVYVCDNQLAYMDGRFVFEPRTDYADSKISSPPPALYNHRNTLENRAA